MDWTPSLCSSAALRIKSVPLTVGRSATGVTTVMDVNRQPSNPSVNGMRVNGRPFSPTQVRAVAEMTPTSVLSPNTC